MAKGDVLAVALLHFHLAGAGMSDSCQLTQKAVVADNLAGEGFCFVSFWGFSLPNWFPVGPVEP